MNFIKKIIIYKLAEWNEQVQALSNKNEIERLASTFSSIGKNYSFTIPLFIEGNNYITIGDNFRSRRNLRLEAIVEYGDQRFTPKIEIGDNVTIESDCHIGAVNYIKIGNGVLLASNVYISDHSHGETNYSDLNIFPLDRKLSSKGGVVIGNNVWIGKNVTILPGISIGDNVIIGANSVVRSSFKSNSIIAGIPAKLIKTI